MRFEFIDEFDAEGRLLRKILRDKITDEVLAARTVADGNEVTLTREDNGDSKTFFVADVTELLGGTHLKDLLEFLGKTSNDLIISSGKNQQ
jgi:hypothetical protein